MSFSDRQAWLHNIRFYSITLRSHFENPTCPTKFRKSQKATERRSENLRYGVPRGVSSTPRSILPDLFAGVFFLHEDSRRHRNLLKSVSIDQYRAAFFRLLAPLNFHFSPVFLPPLFLLSFAPPILLLPRLAFVLLAPSRNYGHILSPACVIFYKRNRRSPMDM